jgi:hypothetical protein
MTDEKIKPVVWRNMRLNGEWAYCEDAEFIDNTWTALHDESALAQAREEGRIAGLREALRVSEQAVSDLAQIYGLLQEGKVDEAEDYCRCAAEGYTQDIAAFSETPGASAITRAAEGKK